MVVPDFWLSENIHCDREIFPPLKLRYLFTHNISKNRHRNMICILLLALFGLLLLWIVLQSVKRVVKLMLLKFNYRKKELLTREDLQLPWKPLYTLVKSIKYSQDERHNLVLFPG